MIFKDRQEAGKLLAEKLKQYKNKKNVVVIGLTRGGVVVSHQVAKALHLPHDILVVKKIGAPTNPELAIGAVAPPSRGEAGSQKIVYWDEELCQRLGITKKVKSEKLKVQSLEIEKLEKMLRGNRKPLDIRGKTGILVDDGVATGATVIVASLYLRKQKAEKIIVAVPVISKETFHTLKKYFDSIVALQVKENFSAVGQFYQEFPQVEDEEVAALLSS